MFAPNTLDASEWYSTFARFFVLRIVFVRGSK